MDLPLPGSHLQHPRRPLQEPAVGRKLLQDKRQREKTVYLHVSPLITQEGKELKGSEPLFIKDIGEKFTKAPLIVNGCGNGKAAKLEKEGNQ